MKRYRILPLFAWIALTLFISCEKNELDPTFQGVSRIVISGDSDQGARADSILFSFGTYSEDIQNTGINLIARSMGNLSDAPRIFQLEVDTELTTAQAGEYDFPETITIAPQGFQTVVPVTIRRTARLKETSAKLVLRVVSGSDFEPGPRVPGTLVNAGPSFNIIWNDQLTKPPFWDPSGAQALRWVWGEWSQKKHQLIVDLTGIRDFSALTTAQKYYIQSMGQNYIATYNAEHPNEPYLNEFLQVMGFCSTCL